MKTIRPFANLDHDFFIISNHLIDEIMPLLSPTEFKVLCFILRQTRGYRKDCDVFSYQEIMAGTGIGSSATVSNNLKSLVDRKYILLEKGSCYTSTRYRLNSDFELSEEAEDTSINEAQEDETDQAVLQKMKSCASFSEALDQASCISENEAHCASKNEVPSDYINTRVLNTDTQTRACANDAPRSVHEFTGLTVPDSRHYFDRFVGAWPDYQNKIAKPAWEVWLHINPSAAVAEEIIRRAEEHASGKRFQENLLDNHGRFYPSLAKWLEQEIWKEPAIPWTRADELFNSKNGKKNNQVARNLSNKLDIGAPTAFDLFKREGHIG